MRAARIAIALLVVALVGTGWTYAFHHGGVAECAGCHSMHDPLGARLLVASDPSSTCLTCHTTSSATPSSYHMSTADAAMPAGSPPTQRTPGGDFGWLKKTYTWSVWGSAQAEAGQTHGHNIVAGDFGYSADTDNTTAPGGSMDASLLSCTSCHDPHGQYRRLMDGSIVQTGAPIIDSGSYSNSPDPGANEAVGVYRILVGDGYLYEAGSTFAVDPPAAVAPSSYNKTEATDQVKVAWGLGISEWCATCHPDMHSGTNYVHPVSSSMANVLTNYNTYVASGNMGGAQGTSYLSLVPYDEISSDYTLLKSLALSNSPTYPGPATAANVSCMSCHRAHASGFEYAMRWNPESELIVYNSMWPGTDNTPTVPQYARGRSELEMRGGYYDRPAVPTFATYQRSLCNKCHAQD